MNFFVLFLIFLLPLTATAEPEVTTSLGTIRGNTVIIRGRRVDEFLSIPYAKPPIGDLRFAKPEEVTEKWKGTLIAQTMPTACMQVGSVSMSEDCLYLNIWTPSTRSQDNLLPVLLYIHGGAFLYNSASKTPGGTLSALTENVVVVINYRLTVFGFLFGNTSGTPGNLGLYDQRIAMKWVNENVNKFGGDPHLVTIFGQSSGGFSVSSHLMSPNSWPYFKNAILMSGVAVDFIQVDRPDWALKRAKAITKAVGCDVDGNSTELPESVISCLKSTDAVALLNATVDPIVVSAAPTLSLNILRPNNARVFYPVFGSDFLEKPPREIWKQKQLKPNTSILIGNTFNEYNMNSIINSDEKPSESMSNYLKKITPTELLTEKQISELIKIYFLGINETRSRNVSIQAATQLHGDINFQCPTNVFADIYSSLPTNNVYQYVFKYKPKNDLSFCDRKYPCHASDVQFVFGSVTDDQDIKVSEKWIEVFGNFTKFGQVFWPKYYRTGENKMVPVYYEFKRHRKIKHTHIGFRYFRCQMWRSMVFSNP